MSVSHLFRVQRYDIFSKKHKNKHKISLKTCTIRNNYVILQPELTNHNNKKIR